MNKTLHNNSGHIVVAYQEATILTQIFFADQKVLPVISKANFLADYSLDYHFGFLTNNNDLQEGETTCCDTGDLGSTLDDMLSGNILPDSNIRFLEKSGAIGKIVIIAYLKKNYHAGNYDDTVFRQNNFLII
jgi:hypothetical protein